MSQKFGPLQLKKKIQKSNPTEKKPQIQQEVSDSKQLITYSKEQEQENDKFKKQQFNPVEMAQQGGTGKTQAEIQYDLVRLKRLGDKIEKKMELTYRQKIETFNKKIQKMPEHYDIPKVGPG
ncbi:unnamed protein product (macronuclear) [Paramecium tetraurelia]|uniref:Uncharacterized protein n=1 Tax=Paramecium tetraurelia TaxID=5888 RepID=A0C564_PARTE|nr:uncharacterized protein GSPATT00006430001 [Paramecium tetraurelia]CAK65931.1 unnamed protein product [Paramecium tetraurelia]|eukprot:XP_001433328.1 hypothetical protein (macronuclear) [Paramecium tetraurelia strain d4-2]